MYIISVIPLIIVIGYFNFYGSILPAILVFFSIVIGMFSVAWLPMLVSKYQLRPAIDKIKKNETTWCRVTLDRTILPQFVDKGPYGQTRGVTHKEKADVIDDGEFPCKWLNGNPAIIMYDGLNTSIDLRKSVARKQMKIKFNVRNGIEAYNKAKKGGKTVVKQ